MIKSFMILKRHNLNLFIVIFMFGAFALGCKNCNFSIGNPPVTESEAETIAFKTLQRFNLAVQKGDFQDFQQTEIADQAKAELTVEKINAAFASFIRKKLDITPKSGAKINWSPKPETNGNSLYLNGNYPAVSGRTVNFTLQYIKDAGDWGLKSIDLDVR